MDELPGVQSDAGGVGVVRVSLFCVICGKGFTAKQSHVFRRTTCSKICGGKRRSITSSVPVQKRFQNFIDKGDGTGCWVWTGRRHPFGYGLISRNGKPYNAHRLSYEMHVGPITDGLWVLHRCDNPPCVNPDHLFLGTQSDNMQDCKIKGRTHRTISQDTIERIRLMVQSGVLPAHAAKACGVSRGYVYVLMKREGIVRPVQSILEQVA